MAKFMKVVNHGANQIDLTGIAVKEVRPVELHFNTNGSVTDNPTFAMVMEMPFAQKIYGQFSLETLKECLNELGYEINPLTPCH